MKQAVLSLSGGLDSSTLLLHLISNGFDKIKCLSFDIGQKHKIELTKAKELTNYLRKRLSVDIEHHIIRINGLKDLLVSGLIDNNSMELKKGHYAHSNAITSVVPNRNAIFASISYAVALSMVKDNNNRCIIALGTHMGDYNNSTKQGIYPDCSEEFKKALEYSFKIGNWDSDKVDYYAPYNNTDKVGVIKDGLVSCKKLKLDYKNIYNKTFTSYIPIKLSNDKWISDYKNGSSIERILSFAELGLIDPIVYGDEEGNVVSWDFVKKYALKIDKEFKNNE